MVDIWLFIFLKLVKKHKVELASTASVSVLWSTASRGRHSICLQRRLRSLHGLRHALNMHSVCICAYACTHAAMHSCGHAHMRPCTHARHLPVCSLFCISLPKVLIFSLPRTLMIMLQALLKASQVHLFFKLACRIWFLTTSLNVVLICPLSPLSIMPLLSNSHTTVLASISSMKRGRK